MISTTSCTSEHVASDVRDQEARSGRPLEFEDHDLRTVMTSGELRHVCTGHTCQSPMVNSLQCLCLVSTYLLFEALTGCCLHVGKTKGAIWVFRGGSSAIPVPFRFHSVPSAGHSKPERGLGHGKTGQKSVHHTDSSLCWLWPSI